MVTSDMAFPKPAQPYIISSLEMAPRVMSLLLEGHAENDPIWDFRPNPNRFSLREMIAHVADWNDIYRERIEMTRDQQNPALPNRDEGKIAEERDYAHSNPVENVRRFIRTRATLVGIIRDLSESDWRRPAFRENVGPLDMGEQIASIAGHDGYHINQVLDYEKEWSLQPV